MRISFQSGSRALLVSSALALTLSGCGGGGPTKSVTNPPPDAAGAMNATAGAVMNTSGPQGPGGVIAAPPK